MRESEGEREGIRSADLHHRRTYSFSPLEEQHLACFIAHCLNKIIVIKFKMVIWWVK